MQLVQLILLSNAHVKHLDTEVKTEHSQGI